MFKSTSIQTKTLYEAFFLDASCNISKSLPVRVANPHITVAFKPETLHTDLYGLHARFRVTGYKNNGLNEGVSVEFLGAVDGTREQNTLLRKLLNEKGNAHLTISHAKGATPLDTGNLSFDEDIPDGIDLILRTTFGSYISVTESTSYQPCLPPYEKHFCMVLKSNPKET